MGRPQKPTAPDLASAAPPLVGVLMLIPADQLPAELLDRLRSGELIGLTDRSGLPAELVRSALLPSLSPTSPATSPTTRTRTTTTTSARDSARPSLRIRLDPDHRSVVLDGRSQPLTFLEFELLAHLMAYPHQVQSRELLIETVWDFEPIGSGRAVDVLVARLRRKLGPTHRGVIETVRRSGYRFVPSEAGS
ncbi:winged helix-turn-helix domain-containing protein [Streptacidiphilus sp. MAP5-3]|uniref:winged helix-turn-helix domain-containing protein n=1 Tax=unclassified Streptacidiphilus TaxID=2643834 RepID=UPI003518A18B